MRIRQFAIHLVGAAALILAAPAWSAPNAPQESWIGAWGFVPTPLPPGLTPVVPPAASTTIPMAGSIPVQPPAPAPSAPLLDNPGNVPLATADTDPANVTIRQLVRVSAAGPR